MFVWGGYVTPGLSLYFAGNVGYYWSSVGRSSSSAYALYFSPDGADSSFENERYVGYSIRCVALGG